MRLAFPSQDDAYPVGMGEGEQHVLLKIDTASPLALDDFVALFVGIGNQFERFAAHGPESTEARFFVKEVRAGCIEAELVAWTAAATPVLGAALAGVKHANDLAKFVETFGGRLSRYFKRDGRDASAGKGDLADFHRAVVGIANDPNGSLGLTAASYEDGERQIKARFEFGTAEAREAERQIGAHQLELAKTTGATHERVLMSFVGSDVRPARPGERSKDRARIEAIGKKALPVVYASELAEKRVRHEIADAAENVYKKAFDVDVNVELRDGKPIAYRVVAIHAVIDPPDDEDLGL